MTYTIRENEFCNWELVANGQVIAISKHPASLSKLLQSLRIGARRAADVANVTNCVQQSERGCNGQEIAANGITSNGQNPISAKRSQQ